MGGRWKATAAIVVGVVALPGVVWASAPSDAPGCDLYPDDHVWHASVDQLPVHPLSATWRASIGDGDNVHPDFGAGLWDGGPIGIPYTVVDANQPRVSVDFLYADESDPGPYPIPDDVAMEGGADADGDRHALLLDRDACVLYELFDARQAGDGSWSAGSGAVFDLSDYTLRPREWTSADAAGLPILPGLLRYDEVAAGAIDHAIRFTAPSTRDQWIWPARHQAGDDDASLPPMGAWFRLRADVDVSGFSPQARVIAEAMKKHGMILADNGSSWFISGVPDERWDNDGLRDLIDLTGVDFEAVDPSSLIDDPDSGRLAGSANPPPEPVEGAAATSRTAGPDRIATALAVSQWAFADGAGDVIIARSDAFADALAATPLAATLGAPVLLTGGDGLDPRVADEIERLGAAHAWLLGGPGALSEAVATDVPDGVEVTRLAGPDRYSTAAEVARVVAERGGDRAEWAVVALGNHVDPDRAWPDALGAGVLAARLEAPLLLVSGDEVPDVTATALDGHTGVLVIGGPSAIPDALFDDLAGGDGREVVRISGPDRFATAAAADARDGFTASLVLIVSGRTYADALSAGAAAMHVGADLLLVEPTALPSATASAIHASGPDVVMAIGGTKAVSDATLAAAANAAAP